MKHQLTDDEQYISYMYAAVKECLNSPGSPFERVNNITMSLMFTDHQKEILHEQGLNPDKAILINITDTTDIAKAIQDYFAGFEIDTTLIKCHRNDPDKIPMSGPRDPEKPQTYVAIDTSSSTFHDRIKKAISDARRTALEPVTDDLVGQIRKSMKRYTREEQGQLLKSVINALIGVAREEKIPGVKDAALMVRRNGRVGRNEVGGE